MTFDLALKARADQVGAFLSDAMADGADVPVIRAMRYALEGGKRLRAFLVMESAALFEIGDAKAIHAAAAVEAIHAYSLVHDDLPAMDDDDLRRGRPTLHRKWDEATAVLAGDGLQAFGFSLLTRPAAHPDPAVRVALADGLAGAAGHHGMVLGQAQDIAAETADTPLTLEEITALQGNKTGALIEWSASAGAVMAGADDGPLRAYARALGLGFQIADDLLDVTGTEAETGKRTGKDAEAGKATFVSLLGVEGARARAAELHQIAAEALEPYGPRASLLRDAARFAIQRRS